MKQYEIRANYNNETIVVYQAYNKQIAKLAIENKRFSEPFSFNRMTWIKPSFLWMMERCGYAQKAGQESVLAISIKRSSWEYALMNAVLTHPHENVYASGDDWNAAKQSSTVNVQWDPERSIRGGKLEYRSIQVGISRNLIREYNDNWIQDIQDITPLVHKIYDLRKQGEYDKAKRLLPIEKIYPVSDAIKKRLGMD